MKNNSSIVKHILCDDCFNRSNLSTFITLIGQAVFPNQSNGSLIVKDGKVIGSELIGQNFDDSIYFQPRPSAINYNLIPSGASNLGLSSTLLKEQVNDRKLKFRKIIS